MPIQKQTSEALDILVGGFFGLNRTFDRAVSIMQNKFAMPNAANIIHHKLAHLFPLLADEVTEIKDNWNIESVYPSTPIGDANYENLLDLFASLYNECLNVYGMLKLAYKIAYDNEDFNVQADLLRIMRQYNVIIGQVCTLKDKGEQIVDNFDLFDSHIEYWSIDGLSTLEGGERDA